MACVPKIENSLPIIGDVVRLPVAYGDPANRVTGRFEYTAYIMTP
jgi:hypothetical protein